jgi:hypothetical protein
VIVTPPARSEAPVRRVGPALGQQERRDRDHGEAHRHVQEEDPLPADRVGEHPAEQHADGAARRADGAPDAEGGVALAALREGGHQDRERRRGHQRGADALRGAGGDQGRLARRQPGDEGRGGEHGDADHEDPAPPDQVGDAASQQQQAAEGKRVGAHDPLEILLREPEVHLDGG